jgi:uracil-DNA glycosylase
MSTQREPAFVIDRRARAMLAEMGVRVWMPAEGAQAIPPRAKLDDPSHATPTLAPNHAPNHAPVSVALPVRHEPPLRLPVITAPPKSGVSSSSALDAAQYVIGNLPAQISDYDLVVLGEPCQGAAEQLLGNMLGLFTSVASRIFVAHMVVSHNEAISLHEQLSSLPTKLLLALGPHAAKALLGQAAENTPFTKLRGTVHSTAIDATRSIQIVVTYHPLQLQRKSAAKAMSWQDIRLALQALRQP